MLLSDEQKRAFLEYLEGVRLSADVMAEQIEKLTLPDVAKQAMKKREKSLVVAASIIIEYLQRGEQQTIS